METLEEFLGYGIVDLVQQYFEASETSPTGVIWKISKIGVKKGCVAGSIRKSGYYRISIFNKSLAAHRVLWILLNGIIPAGMEVDHKNGIRHDNSVDNLQLLTSGQNVRAQNGLSKHNTSGLIGVSFRPDRNRWRAQIQRNGKFIHIGSFVEKEDAIKAHTNACMEWAVENGETTRFLNLLKNV